VGFLKESPEPTLIYQSRPGSRMIGVAAVTELQ
jgi:hypothetical protein